MKNWAKIVWAVIIALFIYCLCSCTPQHRLNRLLDRHPYLRYEKDTVTITDTTVHIYNGFENDTVFSIEKILKDTVIHHYHNITTTMYVTDTGFYHNIKADTIRDTIIKKIAVPVEKFVYQKNSNKWQFLWWIIPVLIVIGYFLYKKFKIL